MHRDVHLGLAWTRLRDTLQPLTELHHLPLGTTCAHTHTPSPLPASKQQQHPTAPRTARSTLHPTAPRHVASLRLGPVVARYCVLFGVFFIGWSLSVYWSFMVAAKVSELLTRAAAGACAQHCAACDFLQHSHTHTHWPSVGPACGPSVRASRARARAPGEGFALCWACVRTRSAMHRFRPRRPSPRPS